ncbi:hypothetical protein GCM10008018_30750 [Paenibacillus marchantiophytorum]|uniref:Uncharacterized protein n=1 Tax=Paenibacillus marchantiophytorum TaxID=1619310 RepID=A0ABQ1EQL2_9BACL|nr:hypothetical protein GCM10008018_30750 [Paenibacillus marchantiophytorum]
MSLSLIFFYDRSARSPRASHDLYPMFVIVQEIHIGTFFEHLESTIALILLVSIFIKLSITYHSAVMGLCQLFRLNDRKYSI